MVFRPVLAWITILRKREAFRKAFKSFDPHKVARFTEADVGRLLLDPGIVRSRAKIEADHQRGRASMLPWKKRARTSPSSFGNLAGGKPIQNRGPVPARTPLSEEISKVLKKRGFKFVGR